MKYSQIVLNSLFRNKRSWTERRLLSSPFSCAVNYFTNESKETEAEQRGLMAFKLLHNCTLCSAYQFM